VRLIKEPIGEFYELYKNRIYKNIIPNGMEYVDAKDKKKLKTNILMKIKNINCYYKILSIFLMNII
jgi:hypothetical protein